MRDKILKLCVLIYALGISLSACTQDIDRYRDFAKQGVLDITVSNYVANEIVRAGIRSNDAEIVNLTIEAIALLAAIVIHDHDLTNPYGPTPSRTFPEVPGLKEFLHEHWQQQYENNGYSTDTDGAWPSIPQILCTFWPRDADVHELLWYQQDTNSDPNKHIQTLGLLNIGKFTTPEAYAFRMNYLSEPGSDHGSTYFAVAQAAEGLALNHPIDALPHLIAAGKEHYLAHKSIWVALSAYDDQLAPYAGKIQAMLRSGKSIHATKAESAAYDRLKMFTYPSVVQ